MMDFTISPVTAERWRALETCSVGLAPRTGMTTSGTAPSILFAALEVATGKITADARQGPTSGDTRRRNRADL